MEEEREQDVVSLVGRAEDVEEELMVEVEMNARVGLTEVGFQVGLKLVVEESFSVAEIMVVKWQADQVMMVEEESSQVMMVVEESSQVMMVVEE